MDPTDQIVNLFDFAAERYQEKYMDLSLYHQSLNLFLDKLPLSKPKVLELGCGPGNISQYLLKQCPELQLLGTDLAPTMLELAHQNNPGSEFQQMDCRDLCSLNQKFDGIIGGFCLPYLSREDAIQLIHNSASCLSPSGVLYLSTMEDDYSRSGMVGPSEPIEGAPSQMYTWYHEGSYLIEAMENAGFHKLKVIRQDFPGAKPDTYQDLILIGQK